MDEIKLKLVLKSNLKEWLNNWGFGCVVDILIQEGIQTQFRNEKK